MNKFSSRLSMKDKWSALADVAVRGLRTTYAEGLPHTMRWSAERAEPYGTNVRYALIALLGLGGSEKLGYEVDDLIAALWARLKVKRHEIARTPGDVGLALWAQALTRQRGFFSAVDALQILEARQGSVDSVHLAWLMLGADEYDLHERDAHARELAERARSDLMRLYNADSRLFYRHERSGLIQSISRRVPCFANQIYPVMALAAHARCRGDREAEKVGRAVAGNLSALQGPLGQWWWLYDAQEGGVVEGYPVFSVHQDAMAPMALMETANAGGPSYSEEISRGLSWIGGANELEVALVFDQPGLVLRDIHRRGIGRVARAIHSAAWCWRARSMNRDVEAGSLEINPECRPYHLGWILYAASLACAGQHNTLEPLKAPMGSGSN